MSNTTTRSDPNEKQRGAAKMKRVPIKIVEKDPIPKPDWIRIRILPNNNAVTDLKAILRENK